MKTLKLLFIICNLLTGMVIQAQEGLPKNKKTIYSFVPQYLINRGVRVDFDKKISDRHWIQFSPQLYLAEKSDEEDFMKSNNAFTKLIGVGLGVNDRIFVNANKSSSGLYFSYGANYTYYNIEFNEEQDLATSKYTTSNINKLGLDALIGYQIIIQDVVSFDVYTGLGTRHSVMQPKPDNSDRFSSGYYGYNYTGNLMLLGVRIGVVL